MRNIFNKAQVIGYLFCFNVLYSWYVTCIVFVVDYGALSVFRRVLIVLECTVIGTSSAVGTPIGNPTTYKIGETNTEAATTAPSEPPQKLQKLNNNGKVIQNYIFA